MVRVFLLIFLLSSFASEAKSDNYFTFKVGSYRSSLLLKIYNDEIEIIKMLGSGGVDDQLLCKRNVSSKTIDHVHSTLKELGVYQWEDEYNPDISVKDGMAVHFRFVHGNTDIKKQIHRQSVYPKKIYKLFAYINELTLLNGCEKPYNKALKWEN